MRHGGKFAAFVIIYFCVYEVTCFQKQMDNNSRRIPNCGGPKCCLCLGMVQSHRFLWRSISLFNILHERSWDSSVGIATGYRLDGPGWITGIARFFFSPHHPDSLWGQPSPLSNGHREHFPRE
jgi:hypothetical protein